MVHRAVKLIVALTPKEDSVKNGLYFYACSCFLAVTFVILPLQAQPDPNSPWPMFHGDVRNTGRSPFLASQKGELLWSYFTGGDVTSSASAGSDGTVYFGSGDWDNNIYALSFEGDLLWSYTTGEGILGTCALSSHGNIYCGSSDNRFYALTHTAGLAWSYETGGANSASPVEADDGTIYFGSEDNSFYALSETGSQRWSYRMEGKGIKGEAAIGTGGEIYIGSISQPNSKIYALESTSALKWSYGTIWDLEAGIAIGDDDRLYFGTTSEITYLYSFTNAGEMVWRYLTGNIDSTPAISTDGTIYFGANDYRIYALHSNCTLHWSYMTGAVNTTNSTAALGIDGTVYTSSKDNACYALNSSGSLKWSYDIGDSECAPSIGLHGAVYVGSLGNVMYAFEGPPTATPTQTPTPFVTPTPNYVELRVTNGAEFNPGAKVVLRWDSYQDRYEFAGKPCAVYLAAALNPPAEDTPVTVNQIVASKALFIFDSKLRPVRYNPRSVKPTYPRVAFPAPGVGSGGTISFTVPRGAAGRWGFAAAFVRLDNKQFPSQPPVEVSHGFNLR